MHHDAHTVPVAVTVAGLVGAALLLSATAAFPQEPEWVNFTSGRHAQALADDGRIDCGPGSPRLHPYFITFLLD